MPLDEYTRKVVQARRRGTAYPYEILDMITAPQAGGRAEITGGSFTEYDLDGDRLVPVDRPYGSNTAALVVGVVRNTTERYPEGMARVTLLGDPDARARITGRTRVPAHRRRARSRRRARCSPRLVRAVGGSEDRHGQRHREHGLDRGRAAADHPLHPSRRRRQRGGDRHQRRRPAVLERRSDDADAHEGHPRDDARLGDGAHRQAGARLLGWHIGRRQLRHRRLRAHHGTQRPGPVLGARPRRGDRRSARPPRPHLRRAGRAVPSAGVDHRSDRSRRVRSTRTTSTGARSRRSATSSRNGPTPTASWRSTSAP